MVTGNLRFTFPPKLTPGYTVEDGCVWNIQSLLLESLEERNQPLLRSSESLQKQGGDFRGFSGLQCWPHFLCWEPRMWRWKSQYPFLVEEGKSWERLTVASNKCWLGGFYGYLDYLNWKRNNIQILLEWLKIWTLSLYRESATKLAVIMVNHLHSLCLGFPLAEWG